MDRTHYKREAHMTFVSYAQNFEDVMLWRALKHINQGFYIDVGAWSPDLDSVTYAFYERGWHGINIEPNPEFHTLLMEKRPLDINLKIALGDMPGSLSMNFLDNPGLSTLDDAIALQHQQAGWHAERQPVEVSTLAAVWAEYVPEGQEVHFLKVDVEGFEEAVLRGNQWQLHRPWVVVVEATLPMSQTESYQGWEPILLNADYLFAYADGLNRFYVAKEHANLLEVFKYPPNVFDEFKLRGQQQAESRANQAEANAREVQARAEQAEQRASEALQRAEQAEERAHHAENAAREASEHAVAAEARAEHAEAKAEQAALQAAQANERANQAEVNAREAEARAEQAEQRASEALQAAQLTDRVMQAEARAHEAEQRLAALYNSISWRITAPLRTPPVRFVYRQIIRIKEQGFIGRVKFVSNNLLKIGGAKAVHFIKDHPGLYNTALKWIHRLGLYEQARVFYRRVTRHNSDAPSACPAPPVMDTGLEDLSPRAREIYLQLKEAVERRHK
jgi:FkbM family methyltransferase